MSEPTMTEPQTQPDVLTLHRRILARLAGPAAIARTSGTAEGIGHMVRSAEQWMARMPGLASLAGGFGPQAWDLARSIAESPQLLSRLGASARALQVAELADLVQIVLEEEELAAEEAELTETVAKLRQSSKTQTAKAQAPAKQTAAAQSRARKASSRPTNRRPASPTQVQRLQALRKLVGDLRTAAGQQGPGGAQDLATGQGAFVQAGGGADQVTGRSASLGSFDPTGTWTPQGAQAPTQAQAASSQDPAVTSRAAGVPSIGAARLAGRAMAPGFDRAIAVLQGRAPAARRPDAWLHPLMSTAEVATAAPRSLRMAQQAADLALLEPGFDLGPDAFGGSVEDARSSQSFERAAAQTARTGGSLPAAYRAASAQAAARASAASGQAGSPAGALATEAAWARAVARAPAAYASLTRGTAPASATAGAAPTAGASPTLNRVRSATAAQAPSQSGAPSPGMVDAGAYGADEFLARPQAYQASGGASTLPALAGSVATAARLLGRSARFDAVVAGRTGAGRTVAGRTVAGRTVADAGSDRLATLRAANAPADVARAHGLLPRLGAWLADAREALAGTALAGASATARQASRSASSAPTLGYAASQTGAGEHLAPGFEGFDATTDLASVAQAGPGLARRQAAQQQAFQQQISQQAAALSGASALGATRAGLATSAAALAARSAGPGSGSPSASAGTPAWLAPATAQHIAQIRSSRPGAEASAASSAGAPMGTLGLALAGQAGRLVGRHLQGLDPLATAPLSRDPFAATTTAQAGGATFGAGVADPSFAKLAPLHAARAVAGRAAWSDAAGAGEWLSLAEEQDLTTEAGLAGPQAGRTRADRAAATTLAPRGAGAQAAGRGTNNQAPTSADRPAMARAAAAAIAQIVRQGARPQELARALAAAPAGAVPSLLALALGDEASALSVRPQGRADAATPWLQQRLDRQAANFRTVDRGAARPMAGAGAEGEFLSLGDDMASLDGQAAAASEASAGRAAAQRRADTRASSTAGRASVTDRKVGSGALESRQPAALKAALALFGEAGSAVTPDVARTFLARWFGRGDVEQALAKAAGKALRSQSASASRGSVGGEVVALRPDLQDAAAASKARTATRATETRSARALGAEKASGSDKLVLTGLAALAALGRGLDLEVGRGLDLEDSETGSDSASTRLMQTPDLERALVQPGLEGGVDGETGSDRSGGVSAGSRSARAGASGSQGKATGVRMHEFAPVGLRRGRDLLSTSRRAGSLVRTAPRVGGWRSRLGYGATALGYGASALGGGELLGLGTSESNNFYGDFAASPGALQGAERLSSAVQARRSGQPMRGGRNVASAPAAAPQMVGADGAMSLPADFRHDVQLVDPAAAVQQAVAEAGRFGGATAATRSNQAGAMARVLSVTSSPAANVLPLVAPAAQAIVSAAAAKPLSESIVTSGSDPSLGMPVASVAGRKQGSKEQQEAQDASGSSGQDLDALAMKIARSVMVRIKRERERRGIHG